MKKKYQVIAFFLSCFIIFFFVCCGEKDHPKDADLIASFQSHKEEFSKLLQMFQEDEGLGRVANDFTRKNLFENENPKKLAGKDLEISNDRLNEYRILYNKLGISAGIEGYGNKDIIWFHASTQGLAVSGSSKGYTFLVNKPELLVKNLDEYWSKDGKSFTAFRHIEGNWYLYFDYED